MCSGRVDLSFVFRAFSKGLDGVFIGGCHFNECHYLTEGNYHALAMVLFAKRLLRQLGLNPDRLRMEQTSAGEGIRFAEIMNDFSRQVRELGPLGHGQGENLDPQVLKRDLGAVNRMIPYLRLLLAEKLTVSRRAEAAYRDFFESEEFEKIFQVMVVENLEKARAREGERQARAEAVDLEMVDRILDRHPARESSLIRVLMEIQHHNRWLPGPALRRVSERLSVPLSRVMQVATFYKTFSLVPRGRHEVRVCTGISCHLRGSGQILDKLQEATGASPGGNEG